MISRTWNFIIILMMIPVIIIDIIMFLVLCKLTKNSVGIIFFNILNLVYNLIIIVFTGLAIKNINEASRIYNVFSLGLLSLITFIYGISFICILTLPCIFGIMNLDDLLVPCVDFIYPMGFYFVYHVFMVGLNIKAINEIQNSKKEQQIPLLSL